MKAFHYTALDPGGRRLRGTGYAAHAQGLRDQLLDARINPLTIRPALFQGTRRLSLTETEAARFARDLAQLLSSGLAITQALTLIASRETARLAAIAREVRARLGAGEPLSVALGAAEGQPARFLQALARGGEASGRQTEVLAAGATSLAATSALKRRMITLSVYPAFVILVAFGSIAIYAYAVLPSLEPAFENFQEVPAQTRAVLVFGAVVRAAVPVVALLALATGAGLAASSEFRRLIRDGMAAVLMRGKRSALADFVFADLASRLAVMLQAGVPLAAAWRLAREPVSLTSLSRRLEAQDHRLMEGVRLSEALAATPNVPADLIHYVSLGEQSGQVAKSLTDAAAAIGGRAQETIERLLSIVTPVVIIAVGGMVGLITMMVFQGLLAVGDAVG
ncbi:type II secretion system F family protein [Brevundimonas sp.]|uniref:type II secretion system F family protein n=1 Tax=Brevundimonas sp. TaxID=1871086 RepID=UPI001A1A063C|nr:type II secretion system F family protein [Brevundimonas sp.]MBJ7484441.1 type II secretion system F family protein [Brevundimonas sp.]